MMLSSQEQKLCKELLVTPSVRARRISKEEFLERFPSAVEDGAVSLLLLEEAVKQHNAEDLQCLFIVGHVFGFLRRHIPLLKELVVAPWHVSHENVVGALNKLGGSQVVDALFSATQWVPAYLNYDESRALAVSAIWALGRIDDLHATRRLEELSRSEDQILRENAVQQLVRRTGPAR